MKHHIYHMVPKDFFGDTLHPLNKLAEINRNVYEKQRAKYEDHPYRKTLPYRRLPKLNCLWNDVLHFSPINPKIIFREWRRLGDEIRDDLEWFAVPISSIRKCKIGIYHHRPENWTTDRESELDQEYDLIEPDDFQELTQLRPETIDWYRSWIEENRRGAYFMYIPHILVQGEVNVSGFKKFKWSEPL